MDSNSFRPKALPSNHELRGTFVKIMETVWTCTKPFARLVAVLLRGKLTGFTKLDVTC